MMGRFTLSLILLALPAAISFVGVGPLPGPNFAPSLAPRSAPTRQPFTTPALSFAPRRPDTFHGVLGSTGSGAVRVWGGQVLRSSRHTPDQVELANRAMQGDGDAWMAAPSKEAADGSKTPNTMGTTGSRIDYQRKPETAKQASQEQAAPFSAAGNLAAQMRKRETAADDQREAEQNRRGRQRETAAEDQRRSDPYPAAPREGSTSWRKGARPSAPPRGGEPRADAVLPRQDRPPGAPKPVWVKRGPTQDNAPSPGGDGRGWDGRSAAMRAWAADSGSGSGGGGSGRGSGGGSGGSAQAGGVPSSLTGARTAALRAALGWAADDGVGAGRRLLARRDEERSRQVSGRRPVKAPGSGGGLAAYMRCACCVVDCSDEAAFVEHMEGRKHKNKSRGRPRFMGLLPNAQGRIAPIVNAVLRAEAHAFGMDPDGDTPDRSLLGPWTPKPSLVKISFARSDIVKDALDRTKHLHALDADTEAPTKERRSQRDGIPGVFDGKPGDPPPLVEGGGPHVAVRRNLPVFKYREAVLEALRAPASLVEGETGSGKTTQVAQYLLEEAAENNTPINIICTQPRRISAMSVAERVAAERGEKVGSGCVGYSIRGESRTCVDTRLLFCTTGVLLRRLEEDPTLAGVTHVLVDEVHERTIESDFLLMTLQGLLANGHKGLSVCMMSATMDGDVLGNYFNGCPRVSFPGRAFPVKTFHLEDALQLVQHRVKHGADWALGSMASERRRSRKGDFFPAPSQQDFARRFPKHGAGVCEALATLDHEAINIQLIVELVTWYVGCGGGVGRAMDALQDHPWFSRTMDPRAPGGENDGTLGSAVLIFLPGTKEIQDVQEALQRTAELGSSPEQREWVMQLHGSLPPDEQRRVFLRPPPGIIKVVLATNVAETSVTIDDVGVVIDSGRVKEERYLVERRMGSLEDVWVSRASAKQRRGRAGRVQEGIAFHLFPSDAPLQAYTDPEVRRVALEQLVLRTKALNLPGSAAAVCARLPEPPAPVAVASAVVTLVGIGALSNSEKLTPLGQLLIRLPVDVHLGKLILYGVCFGAADEALTMAAALASRSPFLMPMERREQADRSKKRFTLLQSDHLAVLNAYNQFDSLRKEERFAFARERFLGIKTLQQIGQLKRQLLESLSHAGIVPPGMRSSGIEAAGRRKDGTDGVRVSINQEGRPSTELLAGLLCAGLWPSVAVVNAPKTKKGKDNSQHVKLLTRNADFLSPEPEEASVHPSSVNSKLNGADFISPYVVFHERVQTTKIYIRDCSPVPPLAILLFGGGQLVKGPGGLLTVDDWLGITVPPSEVQQIVDLRERLDDVLNRMLHRRAGDYGGSEHLPLIDALSALVEARVSEPEVVVKKPVAKKKGNAPPQKRAPPKNSSKKSPEKKGWTTQKKKWF